MASPVYLWYTSEVFFWRSLASSCWSIICLPCFLFLYSLLSSISMTNPFAWFLDAFMDVISLRFTFVLLVFGATMIVVTWFSLPYFSVKPTIDSSKLAALLGLFRLSRLTLFIICVLNGVLAGWAVSHLASPGFEHLSEPVDAGIREIHVLNEKHLFIVGCGLFTSFYHFCMFFWQKKYYLTFPHIQRRKLFQTRNELTALIFNTFWQTLHVMKYYYIIYFLFGGLPKYWIHICFGLPADYYAVPIDSIKGLFDLSLAWQTFLTSYLITYAWSAALVLTRIFQTEHLEFPIVNVLEDMKGKTLADALSCSYSPLLQCLAFLDLAWLTKFSPLRVQEVLSLSQPGGHPKIWTSISEAVFNEIWKLNMNVQDTNFEILSSVQVNPHQNGVSHTSAFGNSDTTINSSIRFRGPGAAVDGADETEEGFSPIKVLIQKLYQVLSRLPLLSQLLVETPYTRSRHLFAECQLHIWAVEGLSNVAVRAYTEDKYGIVQGSLPIIFSSFLDLNESMEKHFKLTSVGSRRHNGFEASSETMLRYKLHSALKSALYHMVNTYRPHLNDLNLTLEEIKKLSPFMDYTA